MLRPSSGHRQLCVCVCVFMWCVWCVCVCVVFVFVCVCGVCVCWCGVWCVCVLVWCVWMWCVCGVFVCVCVCVCVWCVCVCVCMKHRPFVNKLKLGVDVIRWVEGCSTDFDTDGYCYSILRTVALFTSSSDDMNTCSPIIYLQKQPYMKPSINRMSVLQPSSHLKSSAPNFNLLKPTGHVMHQQV